MFEAVAVVIEVPKDTRSELGSALVAGCSAALGQGQCQLASQASVVGRWLGVVSDVEASSPPRVMLELFPRQAQQPVATRNLEFSNHDGAVQLWESVGAILAAMVAGHEANLAATPAKPPPKPQPIVTPPTPRPARPRRIRKPFSIGIGASLASGAKALSLRTGVLARFSYQAVSKRFAITGALAGDTTWNSPAFVGITASVGGAIRMTSLTAPSSVALRAEGALQLVSSSLRDPEGRRANQRLLEPRAGGRLALDFGMQLSPRLSFSLSPEVLLLKPVLKIELGDERVISVPATGWNISGVLAHHF